MAHSKSSQKLILSKPHTNRSVCFIGHREIVVTDALVAELREIIVHLIVDGVTVFNFGSHSQFDELCYQMVTALQKQYPQIRRVHYCAPRENYQSAGVDGMFEQEIDCEQSMKAGKGAYQRRNRAMIDASTICVFYYDANYQPPLKPRPGALAAVAPKIQTNSGTALAYTYATRQQKEIINLYK